MSGVLSPDAFDEMMDGLPEAQRNISLGRIADFESQAYGPTSLADLPEGYRAVTNLKYQDEVIWMPEITVNSRGDQVQFTGQIRLQFMDGRLQCTEEQANFIKSVCPYVYIEPTEGPIHTYAATGFQTRVTQAYDRYAALQSMR
jgi:hypothetical protein